MLIKNHTKLLLCALLCLLAAACASPRYSQELEMGKLTFQSGDYRQSFKQLLPVAAEGKPEAEYAVGYMYYYGYGVPLDTESGLFWMKRAAQHKYGPAIEAMKQIEPGTRY